MMMKALLSADDNGGVGQGDRDDGYEDDSNDDDDDKSILTLPAVMI